MWENKHGLIILRLAWASDEFVSSCCPSLRRLHGEGRALFTNYGSRGTRPGHSVGSVSAPGGQGVFTSAPNEKPASGKSAMGQELPGVWNPTLGTKGDSFSLQADSLIQRVWNGIVQVEK